MTVAVLPASFDPITLGHVDVATRAAGLFDLLVVAVYAHPRKHVMFPLDERVAMVRESLSSLSGVEVRSFDGLVVDLCRELGANVLVRGLRTVADFESEFQQSALNRRMLPGLEVVSLFGDPEYSIVSSSMVKEIAQSGGDVRFMVPAPVARRLTQRAPGRPASLVSGG